MKNVTASRGFTLIEALIALLVLSIGLLGMAAMQLKALQGAHAGYQRSVASLAAQDAQELLWADLSSGGTCPDKSVVNGTGSGTWYARWLPFLPGLDSLPVSAPDPNSNCEFDIKVRWSEARFSENSDGQEVFTYEVRLPGGA